LHIVALKTTTKSLIYFFGGLCKTIAISPFYTSVMNPIFPWKLLLLVLVARLPMLEITRLCCQLSKG